ncbi:MAG TPA: hypothetical protein VEU52_02985 [Candidatus Limnocylindrales bacterium]|nr:hypothetical protein [Candidatus Limnocylindrales bacterium]
MHFSPTLILHICSGIFGVLSGAAAMIFRKGSDRHRTAGNVFVISMMSLAVTGVYLAVVTHTPGNIFGGTLTFYLVVTAWATARRTSPGIRMLDWFALLIAFGIAAFAVTFGVEAMKSPTGMKAGYPPGPYFFLGTIAGLSVVGDVRMILRRGISGTQRIARHLWRMCFALFIASASIFLARQHLFPAILRRTGVLMLLSLAPLLLMIFWLIRNRSANARKRMQLATTAP